MGEESASGLVLGKSDRLIINNALVSQMVPTSLCSCFENGFCEQVRTAQLLLRAVYCPIGYIDMALKSLQAFS